MSQAFITCPDTGRPAYVGLNFEWPQLEALAIGDETVDCRQCGKTHAWNGTDINLRADCGG